MTNTPAPRPPGPITLDEMRQAQHNIEVANETIFNNVKIVQAFNPASPTAGQVRDTKEAIATAKEALFANQRIIERYEAQQSKANVSQLAEQQRAAKAAIRQRNAELRANDEAFTANVAWTFTTLLPTVVVVVAAGYLVLKAKDKLVAYFKLRLQWRHTELQLQADHAKLMVLSKHEQALAKEAELAGHRCLQPDPPYWAFWVRKFPTNTRI